MSEPDTTNPTLYAQDGRRVCFTYKNWRGEISRRHVEMHGVFWGPTEWHPESQWVLQAFDLDKREHRLFAMHDISDVTTDAQHKTGPRDNLGAGGRR